MRGTTRRTITGLLLVALLAGGLLGAPKARAGDDGQGTPSATSTSDEKDPFAALDLDAINAPPPGTSAESAMGATQWLGRLHPMLVHIPIGWTILLVLFDLFTLLRDTAVHRSLGLAAATLTLLSYGPAIATGLLTYSFYPNDPEAVAAALLHRNLMFTAASFLAAAVALRWAVRSSWPARPWGALYMALLALALTALTLGGHAGARLTLGRDYLPMPGLDQLLDALL